MSKLAVKNFERYQHYKDRSPKWIKLYNELLDDYQFLALSEIQQRHLLMIWLIASRHENRIPYDVTYITRAIHAKRAIDLQALIDAGFLSVVSDDVASDVLAEPAQVASKNGAKRSGSAMLEKRRGEKRKKEMGNAAPDSGADPAPTRPPNWPARFHALLAARGKFYPIGQVGALLKAPRERFGDDRLFNALAEFLDCAVSHFDEKPAFVTLPKFVEHCGLWVERFTPKDQLERERRLAIVSTGNGGGAA